MIQLFSISAPLLLRARLIFILAVMLPIAAVAAAQEPSAPAPAEPTQPQGQVIFHRSEDQPQEAPKPTAAPRTSEKTIASITDAERSALAFARWNLDLHLTPQKPSLDARSRFTVRNASSTPLKRIVLQISSALHWDSITSGANLAKLPFTEHTLATDAHHTGQATEPVLTLPHPLAPNATLDLTALYSGTIQASGQRLTRIGAP